jgi:hypothetical protein
LGQPVSFNFGVPASGFNLQKHYFYDSNHFPSALKMQNITYTAFNKPSRITKNNWEYDIEYAADDEQ